MYLSRKLTENSVTDIGKSLGNRDHSTVLHGFDKISTAIDKDSSINNTIDILIKKINNHITINLKTNKHIKIKTFKIKKIII